MSGAREIERPEVGYWMLRLVTGGAEVPACIEWRRTAHEPGDPENVMERSPQLCAEIAGEPCDWRDVWHRRGRRIGKSEYDYQMADLHWARQHARHEPKANAEAPIDLLRVAAPF